MGFANEFVERLAELRFEHAFNPYADVCPCYDLQEAPTLRRDALTSVIDCALERGVDSLRVGEAPGHLGARRTGLPFTDDYALEAHGERWGLNLPRPTTGAWIKEPTTQAVWKELPRVKERVFLWNVFPLHPHEPGEPFSNREPNAQEFAAGREALRELTDALNPARLVAIGKVAAKEIEGAGGGREVVAVRHPGHGGQREFAAAIREMHPGDEKYAG